MLRDGLDKLDSDMNTELLKIKTYRAPRDKIICVLNCCKVIFGVNYRAEMRSGVLLTSNRAFAQFQTVGYIRRLICSTSDICRSTRKS